MQVFPGEGSAVRPLKLLSTSLGTVVGPGDDVALTCTEGEGDRDGESGGGLYTGEGDGQAGPVRVIISVATMYDETQIDFSGPMEAMWAHIACG